jgi:hypothetical protein
MGNIPAKACKLAPKIPNKQSLQPITLGIIPAKVTVKI